MGKKKQQRKICVNLGCGNNIMQDTKNEQWTNVDNYFKAHNADESGNFLQADIRHLPILNESVDYVICDQVLEHIPMADVPVVLHEIRRILKPGGHAFVIVPDFRSAAEDWLKWDWNTGFQAINYQYLSEVIYGNQHNEGEYHRTPFSGGYLNYVLNMVGLTDHMIVYHPAGEPIFKILGVTYAENARLRNAQLVAEIKK